MSTLIQEIALAFCFDNSVLSLCPSGHDWGAVRLKCRKCTTGTFYQDSDTQWNGVQIDALEPDERSRSLW